MPRYILKITSTQWLVYDLQKQQVIATYGQSADQFYAAQHKAARLNDEEGAVVAVAE